MRTFLYAALLVAISACAEKPTAPVAVAGDLVGATLALSQTGLTGTVTLVREIALLQNLPTNLKLSDEQRAKINQLTDAHAAATRADRDALNSIATRAMSAMQSGKSRDEVVKILNEATSVQLRLAAADAELVRNLTAVLTQAQRDWLQSQIPQPCDRFRFPPLTPSQQAKIVALDSAFAANNRADLDQVKSALTKADEARRAGKSATEIDAIMSLAKPALDRLAVAMKKLQEDIASIYSPEQKASGCVLLG
jgi:glutamyl/glutaminyl-tRNA synthetase